MKKITNEMVRFTQKNGGYKFEGVTRAESKELAVKLADRVNAENRKNGVEGCKAVAVLGGF